ncbi:aminotransferase class V-fold PLP-dependent enzyme [Canibacter sp. lx-45]|uniref:aminotransferase class I/II-fold pyridoxal phosphate-dependent enzyme n=1 Tax=Canibacter zhuwentaonis TaxID=2837491 RepID=UPI001BDD8E44|nr:aminotransferase class I/II-fold pyridoxal phosphate-dependent enzyme [Canibacter zhuwentaonis]MBT1034766.1 aminotransferase class V-fold PLP-dependent enzyme [Canibacter zhuwentaonis]
MTGFYSKAEPDYDLTEQQQTPYVDAVEAHIARSPISLMVPGHGNDPKRGTTQIADLFGDKVAAFDLPQLLDGIDLGPNAPIVQAHELAAKAWGAYKTWFCTNGASQANKMAAIAIRGLGQNVLVQRSAHSSFTDGIIAAGLKPSFVLPNVDQRNGVSHGLTPEALEAAFAQATEKIDSVYVVSPSYFGATADVARLAEVAHKHGAALVVDCAWGAHFGFHEQLPESPARLGADLVISSTHKLAGSLTQSAMLHLCDTAYTEKLLPFVERSFMMTASTSMSAILQGSLDVARKTMATSRAQIGKSVALANELRERIRESEHFSLLCDTFGEYPDIVAIDPLRIAIDVSKLAKTGHWIQGKMKADDAIFFEMSTVTVIVAVIGAGSLPDLDRIMDALNSVVQKAGLRGENEELEKFPAFPSPGEMVLLPKDAYFGEIETVSAADAIGRVSVDSLAAYPPGIPNVVPGEVITEQLVEFLGAVAASPVGYVRGAKDPLVTQYRVLKK